MRAPMSAAHARTFDLSVTTGVPVRSSLVSAIADAKAPSDPEEP